MADAPTITAATPEPAVPRTPSSWAQALILSRYQLRDYLRSRRFILMMAIVVASGAILTTIVAYFRPAALLVNSDEFYGGLWAGGATFVMIFAGIIFGGDAIAGEFQNRTGYFLMGLPVRRGSVYVGKYLAAFAASLVAVLLYLAIIVGNAVYYLGPSAFTDPVPLGTSFGLAVFYLLALLGTVFLFSSLFKQSLYGVLVVAVLFLFGWTLIAGLVTGLGHTEPWFVISYASQIIGYPLSGTPPHVMVTTTPFGSETTYNPTVAEGIAIMAGYFGLTSVGGLLLFEREEFT